MMYELVIMAWVAGDMQRPKYPLYASKALCERAKGTELRVLETTHPDYRILARCKPNRPESLAELAGKDGWRCYKYGEGCGPYKGVERDNDDQDRTRQHSTRRYHYEFNYNYNLGFGNGSRP